MCIALHVVNTSLKFIGKSVISNIVDKRRNLQQSVAELKIGNGLLMSSVSRYGFACYSDYSYSTCENHAIHEYIRECKERKKIVQNL